MAVAMRRLHDGLLVMKRGFSLIRHAEMAALSDF